MDCSSVAMAVNVKIFVVRPCAMAVLPLVCGQPGELAAPERCFRIGQSSQTKS